MTLESIAKTIREEEHNIILIYAFNATGKTQLSVKYKDLTREDGKHAGVYYNAFSEDIFFWDNDIESDDPANMRLNIKESALNTHHANLTENAIREKLAPYKPKYEFKFQLHDDDTAKGIECIIFSLPDDDDRERNIKISRGEERVFIWCFFLALFDTEGWADEQNQYFFIDDPVSSLDDHNIFITVSTLFDLIEKHQANRKFIITTHHMGFFSILSEWLRKGEKADKYKEKTKLFILSRKSGDLTLESPGKDVFLYHLHLLQVLEKAQAEQLYTFHFALLRQILENVASFLGTGRFSYVLEKIGIDDTERVAKIVNALSHQKVYRYQTETMNPDNEAMFRDIFGRLKDKYEFILHAEDKT